MMNGESPDMKTGSAAQPTPLDTAAAVAMKGAIDHISQEILLGLAPPLNIDSTYAKVASNVAKAAMKTRYSSILP